MKKKTKIVMAAIWNMIPPTMISVPDLDCSGELAATAAEAMPPPTACTTRERMSQEQKIQRYILADIGER